MPASRPKVRAAWPEVEVPTTTYPPASKASRTAAMTVVLPDPATPTTSSTPRPEVVIPLTAVHLPVGQVEPPSAAQGATESLAPGAPARRPPPLL